MKILDEIVQIIKIKYNKASITLGSDSLESDMLKDLYQEFLNENPDLLNILVIDCGIKNSQIRGLLKHNVQLTVVDTKYDFIKEVYNNNYVIF